MDAFIQPSIQAIINRPGKFPPDFIFPKGRIPHVETYLRGVTLAFLIAQRAGIDITTMPANGLNMQAYLQHILNKRIEDPMNVNMPMDFHAETEITFLRAVANADFKPEDKLIYLLKAGFLDALAITGTLRENHRIAERLSNQADQVVDQAVQDEQVIVNNFWNLRAEAAMTFSLLDNGTRDSFKSFVTGIAKELGISDEKKMYEVWNLFRIGFGWMLKKRLELQGDNFQITASDLDALQKQLLDDSFKFVIIKALKENKMLDRISRQDSVYGIGVVDSEIREPLIQAVGKTDFNGVLVSSEEAVNYAYLGAYLFQTLVGSNKK